MKQTVTDTVNSLTSMFFEVWLWVVVGLVGLLAFFGKRLVNRWDAVTDSHMPDHVIENKLSEIRDDMEECQEKLSSDYKTAHSEIIKSVDGVHTRLDNLYELLLKRRKNR